MNSPSTGVPPGYIILTENSCALFSTQGDQTVLNWSGMLFTIVPGVSGGIWDGTLSLYARNEQAKQTLNCEINELRGYIQSVEKNKLVFWLTKAPNPWDGQFEVTATYYYSHSTKDFIAEVLKGRVW